MWKITLHPTHLKFLRSFDIYLSHRRTIRTSKINKKILFWSITHSIFIRGIYDISIISNIEQMDASNTYALYNRI
jgi:hypothetical protein